VYQFELRVTDNQGATGKDTVVITVNAAPPPPNQCPEVNAGEDKIIIFPTNAVNLLGTASDVDGSIVTYNWTKISGPSQFRIILPTQVQTVINNLELGFYQFELRVTDNKGAIGKDTVAITVNKAEVSASFFPNPATDFINVKINSKTTVGNSNIQILDGKGTIVYKESFVVSQQSFVKQFDISKLPGGVYFIMLDVDGIITKLPSLLVQ
jgi:hypothetical protein